MSDITKRVSELSLVSQVEYYRIKLSDVLTERDALQAKLKQLEAELEEERQENASLRGGSMDDYERRAE